MSDIILKFWPTDETTEDKTTVIEKELLSRGIIGDRTLFWNEPAYKLSSLAASLFAPNYEIESSYVQGLVIFIKQKDYGVQIGEEDFEYIDRLNVLTINGGDGELNRSQEFCEILYEITGDHYSSEFELL